MSEDTSVPAVADASAAPASPPPAAPAASAPIESQVAPAEGAPTSTSPFQDEGEKGPSASAEEAAPAKQPAPTLSAPTMQPPLPVSVFGLGADRANPTTAEQPKVKRGVYVDADGRKQECEIVASRKDGSVDILLPATIGQVRRDGVRRRTSEEQVGDFIE